MNDDSRDHIIKITNTELLERSDISHNKTEILEMVGAHSKERT